MIASISLFLWSILFGPKPQSFLLAAIIVPIGIYFWLIIAGVSRPQSEDLALDTQDQNRPAKIPLFILMTIFISSVSFFVYAVINARTFEGQSASLLTISKEITALKQEMEKPNQDKQQYEALAGELKAIKNDMNNTQSSPAETIDTTVLGDEASAAGILTIKDQKNATINVYLEKSLTAKVVGKAQFGQTYTFIGKDPGWYLILLSGKQGYIGSQFVKEVVF